MDERTRETLIKHSLFLAFGLSGTASLIYEVVWTRSLSTVMGSSTYALSTMLAAFMAGLSVGGFLGAKLTTKVKRLDIAFALCELGIGLVGLITFPIIKAFTPLYIKSFYLFHLSFHTFSVVQFAIVFMIMGIPTTLMGLTFPVAIKFFTKDRAEVGRRAGHLFGINSFGSIVGSMLSGFLLIPILGAEGTAITAAALNIFIAMTILVLAGDVKKILLASASIPVFMTLSMVINKPETPVFSYYSANRFSSYDDVKKTLKSSGNDIIMYRYEGVEGNVYLTKYRTLISNGKWEAGDEKGFSLLAYLPYFSHPAKEGPRTVLNIGLGSGHTLSILAKLPLKHIDSVELSGGILEINKRFLSPELFSDPRIEHIQADGRNFLLLTPKLYDAIIVSPSWAVELASAGLFTDEFYTLATKRLRPDGIFATWVDYFLMDDNDLETILRTFSKHFKHAIAWHIEGDNMILVGSRSAFPYSSEALKQVIPRFSPALKGKFKVAMSESAIEQLPDGRINTDDRPIIEFHNAKNIILGPGKIHRKTGYKILEESR